MGPDRSAACDLADVRGQALLRIRVERLKGNRTFSQKPKSRCHHVLQMPQIERRDEAANEYVTWTPMHYVETRLDEQDLYAAWATHTLTWWTASSRSN